MGATAGYYIVTAIAAAASYTASERSAARAEKAQEKATAKELALAGEQAARKRRQQIQQAQLAQSEIENIAATSDTSGSSAVQVAQAGVTSQAAGGISDIQFAQESQKIMADAQQDIFKAQRPKLGEAVVQGVAQAVGGAAASRAGASLFEEKQKPKQV